MKNDQLYPLKIGIPIDWGCEIFVMVIKRLILENIWSVVNVNYEGYVRFIKHIGFRNIQKKIIIGGITIRMHGNIKNWGVFLIGSWWLNDGLIRELKDMMHWSCEIVVEESVISIWTIAFRSYFFDLVNLNFGGKTINQ